MFFRRLLVLPVLGGLVALAACNDASAPTRPLAPGAPALSGGGGGGGGGSSGGGGGVSGASLLPTTPPAPDILMRESFSFGPNNQRPAGGKGTLKSIFGGTSLGGFWLEYPGSKDAQWLGVDVGQSWNFAGCSVNPNELPSPLLAPDATGGCVISDWHDPPTSSPAALMPITVALPNAGYEFSMDGYPAPDPGVPGAYIAIGFTNSNITTSNLTSSGLIWLRVTNPYPFGVPLHYELRSGSLASGKIIASGDGGAAGFNQMAIRYSPVAATVTLSFGGSVVGTFPATMSTPKYLAFEGVGVLDNLVLRQ